MVLKNKQELVKQIEAYGLKHKLQELAKREELRRPFRHLDIAEIEITLT